MTIHHKQDCIFCQIVAGQAPSYPIWESPTHLAFLSIYPNSPGVTVVIPKEHYDSYAFAVSNNVLSDLVVAAKQAAAILEHNLEDVARVALVFEGYGVNHIHAKLFPMHGTAKTPEWRPHISTVKTFSNRYEGYISSHDGELATHADLIAMQNKLMRKNL